MSNNKVTRATLYVTGDPCNFKCSFCPTQRKDYKPEAGNMDLHMIDKIMTKYPSIHGFCVCGFSETLLPQAHTRWIIQKLKTNNKFVGLITNGALLESRLDEFKATHLGMPDYISISLNASNSVQHEKNCGVKCWDKVISGIKKCVPLTDTYLSYVVTQETKRDVLEFIKLATELNVKGVHLHNLLPSYGDSYDDEWFWDNVLTYDTDDDKLWIEEVKKLDTNNIVETYPILISKHEQKRNCQFLYNHLAFDANGSIGICSSVKPVSKECGNMDDGWVNNGHEARDLRASYFGPVEEMRTECRMCFRSWE